MLFVLIFTSTGKVFGQQVKFTTLTTKDGLSSNSVNKIIKDQFGLMWIATLDGLNRYDGKEFKVYRLGGTSQTGFGSKEINVMREDNRGNFWVGTMGGGLYLYDRQQDIFHNYDDNKTRKICNGYIACLYADQQGFLWVGTMGGLDKINTQTQQLTHVQTGTNLAGSISCSNITDICSDKTGNIWIATYGGLYKTDHSQRHFTSYRHKIGDSASLPSDSVSALAEDKNGQMWIGTLNGLAQMNKDQHGFINYRYSYNNTNSICGNLVNSIAVDTTAVWVGTEGGLSVIHLKTKNVSRYQHDARNTYSLNSKSVKAVYIDPQGIYWIGTYENGISKYDKNLTLFNIARNSEFDSQGLNWPVVSSFAECRNGDIYVGCDGGGLSLFHVKSKLFDHIPLLSRKRINASGLPILSMYMDRSQNLWIGTYQHGLFCYNSETGAYKQYTVNGQRYDASQNNIFAIKEDAKGQIWIGTNGAGINIMNPATGKTIRMTPKPSQKSDILLPFNGYVRCFEEDQDGCMWIGTYGSGVMRYHPKSGKFDMYNPQTTRFPLEHILSMLLDNDGNLWIGTGGDGLFKLNVRTNKITAYTNKNGLSNGVIHKIIQDPDGNIWVSTNRGLCMLDAKTGQISRYSQFNGLQGDSFYGGSGLRASDGTLYFGGTEGFNYFKAIEIKKNTHIPPVMLNNLAINNEVVLPSESGPLHQAVELAKDARIAYKQSFSISYIALNYTFPYKNRYRYILDGFNHSWIDAGQNTTAYYTNLDPGTYTFKVIACNNDGVWNQQPASIKIIIPPPFWMTGYFYFGCLLAAAGGLWLIRRNGIQKMKKNMQTDQDRKAAEARHELDNLKIKFLTNLSHEFRTPVSLILTPAEKLLTMNPDKEITGQLKVIKRNSRRLLNLVNQLLDFRKMEEHELRLNVSDGELVQLVREITDSFRDLAEAKKIHLAMFSNVDKVYCRFDHDKIERILFNLLSNAFKFTPTGGQVIVTVSGVYDKSKNVHEINLSVADTGIGLSENDINKVFDRFYQADAPSSIVNQGSGIGLSITKELVTLQGGEITVKSEAGHGTTFSLRLDFAGINEIEDQTANQLIPENIVKAKPESPTNTDNVNKPHVLVIEDNDELRGYLVEHLGSHYKITAAIDGRDGWNKSLSMHPDLILSDVSMPYMDGVSLSKKIKGDKRTSHIPIILVTAHARQEDQMTGLGSGASDYITKPFNFDILNIKIKNLLDLNKKLKDTYQKQVKVMPEENSVESSVEKFIKEVVIYIEQNIHDHKFSVEDISRHFSMSRGSFYNKVIEFTGQSPVEFIRNLKLEKAAVLLRKTDHIIAEIAYKTGFHTPHYFSKSFKAKYGVLPSEYRQQFQQHYDKA